MYNSDEKIFISTSLPQMETTLSEKENALEETVETPLKTVMVCYNESQREKTS